MSKSQKNSPNHTCLAKCQIMIMLHSANLGLCQFQSWHAVHQGGRSLAEYFHILHALEKTLSVSEHNHFWQPLLLVIPALLQWPWPASPWKPLSFFHELVKLYPQEAFWLPEDQARIGSPGDLESNKAKHSYEYAQVSEKICKTNIGGMKLCCSCSGNCKAG